MPNVKVSIIINNYNYGKFLGFAIESALAQTYPNCELIVVDDGSTDESRDLLKKFETRARIIYQENRGQPSAMNAGFEASSGDLVSFLDSDDALFPDAIESVVNAWEENVVKTQFPLEILNPEGMATGLLTPRCRLQEGDLLDQVLQSGCYISSPTSGNVFSRAFLNRILPIPTMGWLSGDAYMSYNAPFFGSIAAFDRPLGFYRIHGTSMSAIASGKSIDLAQMEKLFRNSMAEKCLIEKLAKERGLTVSRDIVTTHWGHLKLRLCLDKLATRSGAGKAKALARSGFALYMSVLKSKELSSFRKLQLIVWAAGVVSLPSALARKLIRVAFDRAPNPGIMRLLRRA
jgi:glycosyltransferase involved in cell wall biosynthesis